MIDRSTETKRSWPAFTLIELLVVIAIIAILASILLPGLAKAKEQGYKAKCINNLHQIGIGIQLYTEDHGEQLPGPTWQGLYEAYDDSDTKRMPYYIAPYMGLKPATANPQTTILLRCPATAKKWIPPDVGTAPMDLPQPLSYICCVAVSNINFTNLVYRPFGYPNGAVPIFHNPSNDIPRKITEIYNPSRSWAITDADQANAVPVAQYYPYQPKTPSHGHFRNQLFFDWHIEGVHE